MTRRFLSLSREERAASLDAKRTAFLEPGAQARCLGPGSGAGGDLPPPEEGAACDPRRPPRGRVKV